MLPVTALGCDHHEVCFAYLIFVDEVHELALLDELLEFLSAFCAFAVAAPMIATSKK